MRQILNVVAPVFGLKPLKNEQQPKVEDDVCLTVEEVRQVVLSELANIPALVRR